MQNSLKYDVLQKISNEIWYIDWLLCKRTIRKNTFIWISKNILTSPFLCFTLPFGELLWPCLSFFIFFAVNVIIKSHITIRCMKKCNIFTGPREAVFKTDIIHGLYLLRFSGTKVQSSSSSSLSESSSLSFLPTHAILKCKPAHPMFVQQCSRNDCYWNLICGTKYQVLSPSTCNSGACPSHTHALFQVRCKSRGCQIPWTVWTYTFHLFGFNGNLAKDI